MKYEPSEQNFAFKCFKKWMLQQQLLYSSNSRAKNQHWIDWKNESKFLGITREIENSFRKMAYSCLKSPIHNDQLTMPSLVVE